VGCDGVGVARGAPRRGSSEHACRVKARSARCALDDRGRGPDDPPRLAFRFAPPLDSYNGEVRTLKGTVSLGPGGTIAGAVGTIEGDSASITMGNKTLDRELREKILKVAKFPRCGSRWMRWQARLHRRRSALHAVLRNRPHRIAGNFGAGAVGAQVEAVLAEDGTPRLDVRATFRLRIKEPFGLDGPDGPAPRTTRCCSKPDSG
jgi:hypothetical protein